MPLPLRKDLRMTLALNGLGKKAAALAFPSFGRWI